MEALLFAAEAKALDSRLRGNDEPRRDGRRMNDSLAVGGWMLMLRKIEAKALIPAFAGMTSQGVTGEGEATARRRQVEAHA